MSDPNRPTSQIDAPSFAELASDAEQKSVDFSRRKLAVTGLGMSAIFTLASRPVWANQCTLSGMMSGNLSAPSTESCEGCTPGYWKQCQHLDSWAATGFSPSDKFNTVFGVTQYVKPGGAPYTLLEVLGLSGNGNCQPDSTPSNCSSNPNGNAIGKIGCDPISPNLGFHAVAAILSAGHPEVNYGYTSGEIIALFKNNIGSPARLKDTLAMLNQRGCPLH